MFSKAGRRIGNPIIENILKAMKAFMPSKAQEPILKTPILTMYFILTRWIRLYIQKIKKIRFLDISNVLRYI